jgi:molybdenum cofactor synthesis domain-containing protein
VSGAHDAPGAGAARRRAALIVVSDRAATGERPDATAALMGPACAAAGFTLEDVVVVPDDVDRIRRALVECATKGGLVLTTGGTGVAPRDVTPEATRQVIEKEVPGLVEEIRRRSAGTNLKAIGSRAVAGTLSRSLVLNLPGRPEGAVEAFGFVAPVLPHLLALLEGPVADVSHQPVPEGSHRPGPERPPPAG